MDDTGKRLSDSMIEMAQQVVRSSLEHGVDPSANLMATVIEGLVDRIRFLEDGIENRAAQWERMSAHWNDEAKDDRKGVELRMRAQGIALKYGVHAASVRAILNGDTAYDYKS